MRDYLDYATNQPMRDGEEMRDFFNSLEDKHKTETILSSLTHSFIRDFRAKKNNATDAAIMLIMLVGSAVGIDISEENANEYITTCKKFGTRTIDATELEQRLDEIINREE